MKVFFYHAGTVGGEEAAKVASAFGKVICRNADYFNETEAADLVVIGDTPNAEKIAEAYKADGVEVKAIGEVDETQVPEQEEEPKEGFDPDAPAKVRKARRQG